MIGDRVLRLLPVELYTEKNQYINNISL